MTAVFRLLHATTFACLLVLVNARLDPRIDWDRAEQAPSTIDLLLQSISVPIDRNSGETLELLRDMMARWKTTTELERLHANLAGAAVTATPGVEGQPKFFAVEISFDEVHNAADRSRLKALPTSFSLKPEDVDSPREAASLTVRRSLQFQAFIDDVRRSP